MSRLSPAFDAIRQAARQRILILDGAMGTQIQQLGLGEGDFLGHGGALAARIDPQHPKIPEVEQILSAGAAAQNVLLAAHALGFGAKWLTGAAAYDDHVKAALGLEPGDRLIGFLHIGTVAGEAPRVPHADPREHIVEWRSAAATRGDRG